MTTKKMVENKVIGNNEVKGNKYSGMVKATFGKALGAPLQLQAAGGKVLNREGAIANINTLYKYKKVTPTNPDQTQSESYALKCSQPEMENINDVMNVANRY
jgi:hypothetical protein